MKVKELNLEECWKVLENKKFGRLACPLANQPHFEPLYFVYDGQKHLYACSTLIAKTIDIQKSSVCGLW